VENPENGPPGYERRVYSFTSPGGDSFFAVLDPYYLTADNPDPYYFSVVDINGSLVTVTSYGYNSNTGDSTVFDSFTIATG
jgi:hypothetical protein